MYTKNVPEEDDDETWERTKELLARVISTNCPTIGYDMAFGAIKRCHRESKEKQQRPRNDGRPSRAGKRNIFAAFFSWDICQTILEDFRKKCINERGFNIFAEQMYGPLTTKRRGMAMELRKRLKEDGSITGGYVAFPAKFFVHRPGNLNIDGKKVYTFHSDFSKRDVDN